MPKSKAEAKKKRRLYWRQEETRYFLRQCLRRDALGQLGVLSRGNTFEQLAMDMRAMGLSKSARQCRGKLKQLKLMYLRTGRDMLFGDEMELLFSKYQAARSQRLAAASKADAGGGTSSSSSLIAVDDIKTEPLDSDWSCQSDSSSMISQIKIEPINEDESMEADSLDFHSMNIPPVSKKKIKTIKTENVFDDSAVNIIQSNAVVTNDSQVHYSLFEQSVLERLGKIETYLNHNNKILQEKQISEQTKLEKIIEQQNLLLKDIAIIKNNYKQTDA